jgi:hypothetical protein
METTGQGPIKVNQMATLKQQGVYWDALDNIETV